MYPTQGRLKRIMGSSSAKEADIPQQRTDPVPGRGEEHEEGVQVIDHDPDPHHERELPAAALDHPVVSVVDGEGDDGQGEEDAHRGYEHCEDGEAVVAGAQVLHRELLASGPALVGPVARLAVLLSALGEADRAKRKLLAGVAAALKERREEGRRLIRISRDVQVSAAAIGLYRYRVQQDESWHIEVWI